MDTQNTPVHIKLWHKDFWRLCFANLLLMSSVYMLVFAIPYFLIQDKYQMWQIGCVLLAYGFGLFLFGGFCSYLVQRYRRNMVCQNPEKRRHKTASDISAGHLDTNYSL